MRTQDCDGLKLTTLALSRSPCQCLVSLFQVFFISFIYANFANARVIFHRKITRAFIWRLTEHNMSYKALYDITYFITLSALVMMFKPYTTYICFLSVMLCFLKNIFVKRHIFLSVILCFLKNIFFKRHIFLSDIFCFLKNFFFFKQHTYVFEKHIDVIEFNRTSIWLVPLNNIYVILM